MSPRIYEPEVMQNTTFKHKKDKGGVTNNKSVTVVELKWCKRIENAFPACISLHLGKKLYKWKIKIHRYVLSNCKSQHWKDFKPYFVIPVFSLGKYLHNTLNFRVKSEAEFKKKRKNMWLKDKNCMRKRKCIWFSASLSRHGHFMSYRVSSVICCCQNAIHYLSTHTSQSNKASRSNYWIKYPLFAEHVVRAVNIHGYVTLGMLNSSVADCAETVHVKLAQQTKEKTAIPNATCHPL